MGLRANLTVALKLAPLSGRMKSTSPATPRPITAKTNGTPNIGTGTEAIAKKRAPAP